MRVREGIVIALITVIGGGLFGVINHYFNKKTQEAKNALTKNTVEVEAATNAIEGMETLLKNYRIEEDRTKTKIETLKEALKRCESRNSKYEDQLVEERALNVALFRELEKVYPEKSEEIMGELEAQNGDNDLDE